MNKMYDFVARLEEIKRYVSDEYLNCIFIHTPHYTIHGKEHSMSMENNLEKFIAVHDLELNNYEEFLLRTAIWLHDIGMMIKKDSNEDLSDVRKNHHIRSQDFIDSDNGRNELHLNHFESNIIGVVSYLHRKTVDIRLISKWYENDCKTTIDYQKANGTHVNFIIRTDLLAMLLRLLDTSDRSHLRSYKPQALQLANIPKAAMYHWSHHLISSVDFEKKIIIINSNVPPLENGVSSNEENIINHLIINDIKREIDSLEWVLRRYNLHPFEVKHNPQRHGKIKIPNEINEEYLNYRHSLQKEGEFGCKNQAYGYKLRSLEKTVCIYKNGHTIVDVISDVIMTGEEGIKKFSHAFALDKSSPHDFIFKNFDLIKEIPIIDRFKEQSIFAGILNYYGKNDIKFNILEEHEVIGDPFKYKEFHIGFSPKLDKNTRIKYGVGLSSPNYFILDEPDKLLRSAQFIRVDTNYFILNLKFETGIIVNEMWISIYDVNNQILIEKNINTTNYIVPIVKLCDGIEGEISYSRERGLYYDSHKIIVYNPQPSRLISTQFKVEKIMERSL